MESHVDVQVAPALWLEGGLDYVHGELTALGKPLPRMPPLRGRAGVRFEKNMFQAGADGIFAGKQDRIYTITTDEGEVGETPTDGYNLLKLYASYTFVSGRTMSTITARLDNATDTRYFNHLNYLKDLVARDGRELPHRLQREVLARLRLRPSRLRLARSHCLSNAALTRGRP